MNFCIQKTANAYNSTRTHSWQSGSGGQKFFQLPGYRHVVAQKQFLNYLETLNKTLLDTAQKYDVCGQIFTEL